jgi:hypothetical protein
LNAELVRVFFLLKKTCRFFLANSNFDEIFHSKVASEVDSEVLLFTKKPSENQMIKELLKFQAAATTQRIELKSEEIELDKPSQSPSYKIEFSQNNRLELVPRSSKDDADSQITYHKDDIFLASISSPSMQVISLYFKPI